MKSTVRRFQCLWQHEIATESLATTYAKEDIASARELTDDAVREYHSILQDDSIGEDERRIINERVGLRIRELSGAVELHLKKED